MAAHEGSVDESMCVAMRDETNFGPRWALIYPRGCAAPTTTNVGPTRCDTHHIIAREVRVTDNEQQ